MPVGDPALLRARHEVVDQHPDPAVRAGPEVAQVARPGRRRRRGTRRPRPRAAGRRPRPSRRARRRAGPRRRSGSAGPRGPARRGRRPSRTPYASASRGPARAAAATRITGLPSSRNPGPSGKVRRLAAPVLERDGVQVAVDGDDLAAEVSRDLLDHGTELGRRLDGTAALRARASRWRARRMPYRSRGHPIHARWQRRTIPVMPRREVSPRASSSSVCSGAA